MRTIGPLKVCWCYGYYRMHQQYPTCTSLTFHLKNEQVFYFDEREDMIVMSNDTQKVTQLHTFYKRISTIQQQKYGSLECELS